MDNYAVIRGVLNANAFVREENKWKFKYYDGTIKSIEHNEFEFIASSLEQGLIQLGTIYQLNRKNLNSLNIKYINKV